jgi:hypothetical protein
MWLFSRLNGGLSYFLNFQKRYYLNLNVNQKWLQPLNLFDTVFHTMHPITKFLTTAILILALLSAGCTDLGGSSANSPMQVAIKRHCN